MSAAALSSAYILVGDQPLDYAIRQFVKTATICAIFCDEGAAERWAVDHNQVQFAIYLGQTPPATSGALGMMTDTALEGAILAAANLLSNGISLIITGPARTTQAAQFATGVFMAVSGLSRALALAQVALQLPKVMIPDPWYAQLGRIATTIGGTS